jgi:hypothetical protein
LIGILITGNLYGQHKTGLYHFPDSIRQYITTRVSKDILQYRVDYNPAITEADKIYRKSGNETVYKDAPWILFEDPEVYESPELLLDIKRWPADSPDPNLYLVTKSENRFATHYPSRRLDGKLTDTLTSAKYDSYDRYFPDDERFLVFYDAKKKIYKNMSGNFYQHGINGSWFRYGSDMLPKIRLAQYPVGERYSSIRNGDTTIYMVNHSSIITHGAPGNILVKVLNKFPYNYLEILFYSNKAAMTGDTNNKHFYEIKQVRDYIRGYPYTPQDVKPVLRLLKQEEIDALEAYYHQPIYNFGNIDRSGIPVKE